MAKRVSVDKWLFGSTLLLVFIGLVMVFSASAVMAGEKFGSPYTFLIRQLAWAVVGVGAMVVCMNIDYRKYKNQTLVYSLLGITLGLLIAVFFLDRSHNTHRWIKFGALSFQPSELAKPAIILFLAFWLEIARQDDHRLETHVDAGRAGYVDADGIDREAAGSRHRHRLRGHCYRACCSLPAWK